MGGWGAIERVSLLSRTHPHYAHLGKRGSKASQLGIQRDLGSGFQIIPIGADEFGCRLGPLGEGTKLGRPSTVTSTTRETVQQLRTDGFSIHRIAKHLKIGVGTTRRILMAAA